jgi:hypothetical protein
MRPARRIGGVFAALLAVASSIVSAQDASRILQAKRRTAADTPIELRTHAHWDDQCRSISLPVVTWVENPVHGRVEQSEAEVMGHAPAVGDINCEGIPMHGLRLKYTPEIGYHGVDHLVYDVRYDDRNPVVRYEFSVTIK